MQSQNYVPGVSGWKLDPKTGDFEINTCTLGSIGGSAERQTVSIEVRSYSKYDLPKNAANLLQFMEAELQKVPEEFRHAAEFEEFDTSYGDDSFSPRLFLSYSRLETEEELADRLERAKQAGVKVDLSKGVLTISQGGVPRVRIGELNMDVLSQPFVTDQGQVFISHASVHDAAETGAKLAPMWSVKMQVTANGQYVAAGIGLGIDSQLLVSAAKFAVGKPTEMDCRLAAIESRLTQLESNRFRRPSEGVAH